MDMSRCRIMMVSSEVSPWARSGGLADVLGALPSALAAQGYEVAVVVPRYMNAADSPTSLLIDELKVPFGAGHVPIGVWAGSKEIGSGSVTLYFIENNELYGSEGRGPGLYGNQQGDYPDNHIRFAVFSRAALEISRRIFHADVFHCHDWQAGLLPVYLRETLGGDPDFAGAKALLTIHNLGYQGLFPPAALSEIGLPPHLFNPGQLEFWGRINFLKAGIVFSDAINTVSRRYAEEIQTEPFGFGLDGLLRYRSSILSGILNGVDYSRWNPATDPHIAANYSPENLAGKLECKRALLKELGLPDSMMDRPLIGVVSRFAVQKGFDLLGPIAEKIFARGAGLVVLGDGDAELEQMFLGLARDFPNQAAVRLGFNDPLAHRIEAGADIFLMPSRYEPCGLNQIYSLKYGTVPVVRATGGLDDTIDESTGFKFHDYNGNALLDAVAWACDAWENREEWAGRMVRGMRKDFSWEPSARAYSELYQRL
ncbi:MAG TPA: glycogen synthase GlgA [Bryobacteraceae bacterium]|nr:glycogen synthase GlgA [Bryobacteraceae bacterium]